jgi:(p)ppGpp synthase/HD superfamily hydrolase
MEQYPQTHLQLYRQLQGNGYGEADLLLVDTAYRIAMRVFSGYYRPNNKPFLMHLVGVAGILARAHQPAFVIAAGLLHSTYSLGLGRRGGEVAPRVRQKMADALGEPAEHLIFAYSSRHWSVGDLRCLAGNLRSSQADQHQLCLVKIADLHEEFIDDGHCYQPQKRLLWDEETNTDWLEGIAELLDALGYADWSRDFRRAVAAGGTPRPDGLLGKAGSSFILAPGLSRSPLKQRLVRWLSRY